MPMSMTSSSSLSLLRPIFNHRESLRLEDASLTSNLIVKDHKKSFVAGNYVSRRSLITSQCTPSRWFPQTPGALSSVPSSSAEYASKDETPIAVSHNHEMDFNRVNCLVWVLHESARSFSLATQTLELTRSRPELAMAWVGVDVHAWHKQISYRVAVYALLKAVTEVEQFLSHKRGNNPSPVREILLQKTNVLGLRIESQMTLKHPKLVQWFRMVELPRIAGLFIPLFKKWSVEYAGSGVAGIILAISCCAAIRKLGSGRLSCPSFSVSIEDAMIELMNASHSLIPVDKFHRLATEAGFEEDFLFHFGNRFLPNKNIEEIEFWIGLLQKKLSVAFHRESVIASKLAVNDKIQENSLASLGLFAFLGRETRLFLSVMNVKDLDDQLKDFLSYLECGSIFIYPEFSSLPKYQLFMEVITDEIEWLDFYAQFSCKFNQERRSKQQVIQAEKEIILYTVLTVCYDVFSGFAHYTNSTQQPLDAKLLDFLLKSQSLLSTCLEDYWAAYDLAGEPLKMTERSSSDPTPYFQIKGPTTSSTRAETQQKQVDGIERGSNQHISTTSKGTNSSETESKSRPQKDSLLRKSTIKLVSASADIWMGTQLLFIDVMDVVGLLMKRLHSQKITKRERKKIERTLADIATLVPITILMLLPVSAVGHAAMLAAIKRYTPSLIPSPYSSRRLALVKQLNRTKKMDVQQGSNTEEPSPP